MNGSECRFIKFMEGSDKRFVIPVYQRNYDWKTEQCKQLFDDLVTIVKTKRQSHFFGSIVSAFNPTGRNEEFQIIDGQQRLTTVSLLFLAMYNALELGLVSSESETLKLRIFEEYLVDKWQKDDTRIKLKPVKNDQKAFTNLFGDKSEHILDSNVTANYDYFLTRIQNQEISVDELYDAISALEIINIKLGPEDNPQLIFESLNSTGLDLSEGDKIRNFILMSLPTDLQELYYEKYWQKIESTTSFQVSAYIRDYLSVKQQAISQQKRVYQSFKSYVNTSKIDTEKLLTDLLAYAKRYQVLLGKGAKTKALRACIDRLNRLETTVTRPYFLEVLRLYEEGTLSEADVEEIFLTTETYLFRRSICGLPTNALNKIFLLLNREIVNLDGSTLDYVSKFKYTLISKRDRARLPKDDEFLSALRETPIYLLNSKNKIYILERFENFDTAEDKDIYRHIEDGTYSIEHIMPQHLTPTWQKDLGPNYSEIHDLWLHRLANLTFTGYNSKYSNASFSEKKTMAHGFNQSGLRMNMRIAQKDRWGEHELKEREDYLIEQAQSIWPMPTSNYLPEAKQLETYSLDDGISFTNKAIARYTFAEFDAPVTSWTEMYQQVVSALYALDPTIIRRCAKAEDGELSTYFAFNPSSFRNSFKLDNEIYALTNSNTERKLATLRSLFKLYGFDAEDLTFYLKDKKTQREVSVTDKEALCMRFWDKVLSHLKDAFAESGLFDNITGFKGRWIDGHFGISGFSMNCSVSRSFARVELRLASSDSILNKRAYDALFDNKRDIENEMGTPLIWTRGDDVKVARVGIQLDGVDLYRESSWEKIIDFYILWTKQFATHLISRLMEMKL